MLIIVVGFLLMLQAYLLYKFYQINYKIKDQDYILEFYFNYNIKNDLDYYKLLKNFINSTVYPFFVVYNCTNNNIIINNPKNSSNVIVTTKYLYPLNTTSNSTHIGFKIISTRRYSDICYFEGYIVYKDSFNSNGSITGSIPLYFKISENFNVTETMINTLLSIYEDYSIKLFKDTLVVSSDMYTSNIKIS